MGGGRIGVNHRFDLRITTQGRKNRRAGYTMASPCPTCF